MSLTVSYGYWLSLTVSDPKELLHVSYCLSLLLTVPHCCHGVAACLSLSPMVVGCLSLFVQSHGVATYLIGAGRL